MREKETLLAKKKGGVGGGPEWGGARESLCDTWVGGVGVSVPSGGYDLGFYGVELLLYCVF